MGGILGDVVMPTLTKTFGVSLAQCIRDAEGPAREAVASGESIRWAHSQGCANNSNLSTTQGSIALADAVIRSTWQQEDDGDELLFGNNLRRAWRALRPLFKR